MTTPSPEGGNSEGALGTQRVTSSIPSKAGMWVYPSEAQFFRTTVSKGYKVFPEDMPIALAVHNKVNETAWQKVLDFEKVHYHYCANPKLVRFAGLSAKRTPKAYLKGLMGFVAPFDSHEWTVDRCGKRVRYLIDFYEGAARPLNGAPISIHLDVRPAVTLEYLTDCLRASMKRWLPPLGNNPK